MIWALDINKFTVFGIDEHYEVFKRLMDETYGVTMIIILIS